MRVATSVARRHGSEPDAGGPGQTEQMARFISPEHRPGLAVADAGAHRLAGESAIRNAAVLAEKRHNVGSAGQV